jgi:hypothetical protein
VTLTAFNEPIQERIIGYDAREYWLTLAAWNEKRKEGFLYRMDVLKVLSIDTRVWPTIFESENQPEPPDRFGILTSWANLSEVRAAVTETFRQKPMKAWRMIAITLLLDSHGEDKVPWSKQIPPASPDRCGDDWTLLGYDVGDQWMLSALSNCGFRPVLDDVVKLRAKWGPRLNQFHLFENLEDAILFARFSDERLRGDHAPCFVYGLWIVK